MPLYRALHKLRTPIEIGPATMVALFSATDLARSTIWLSTLVSQE